MKKMDYIIVGSGFFGAVLAERLRQHGKRVLVLEKRDHIGGNCHSSVYKDTNIIVHTYGTHIFHTSNATVWKYINQFTEFNRYQHRVLTTHRDKVYTLPINLATINSFYSVNLKPQEVAAFLTKKKQPCANPRNLEEKAISLVGRDLYRAFIRGYTMKQWGCDPRELPAEIIERLPVRTDYFDSYYDDCYQGLPVRGYTAIFENMLRGIPVELNTDFFADREKWRKHCDCLIYTGPLDRYFDYSVGKLRWRSVRFERETIPREDFQGTSVMNYADEDIPYTRIHEPKHLHRERRYRPKQTVIIREFACADENEPYYPVNSTADQESVRRYQQLVRKETNVIFGGRLAGYKYYDMHCVIAAALTQFERLRKRR